MNSRIEPVNDGEGILEVINSAAQRYEGAIPDDCYSEPYMTKRELEEEMREMDFHGYRKTNLVAVVGVQNLKEVTLIRHLYVRPGRQRQGIGSKLLEFAVDEAENKKMLVGTWRGADWAVSFYEKNGFEQVEDSEKLLRRHWDIPERQVEESVVLRYGGGER